MKTLSVALLAAMLIGCANRQQCNVSVVETVKTNFVPGYIGGLPPKVGTNGYYEMSTLGVAVDHPPRTEIVTNIAIVIRQGTNVYVFHGFTR